MTDPTPTPTRAEVERCEPGHYGEMDRHPEGAWVSFTDYQALRERAEAAEAERGAARAAYLAHKRLRIDAEQQAHAARRAEAAAWNDAIEAAEAAYAHGFAAIRALRRAAPTEGEAQPLDASTRAVLDRAERIVAGQSQQEQRTAEIFLRPTEGEA